MTVDLSNLKAGELGRHQGAVGGNKKGCRQRLIT